ncbi:MAG: hypothetical protein DWH91_04660 [Planctomycetota bacterium]|nr:MAG: hypothetical protein DWH91_04660 [Planctomycetota bacterium]
MVRKAFWSLTLAALNSVAIWSGTAQADDAEGIIRICDQARGQGAMHSGGMGTGHCPNGHCPQVSQGATGCRTCGQYAQYDGLGGIYMGGMGCPGAGGTGHVHQFLSWFNPNGICTHSPDHGWAPPGKMRTPHARTVAYQKSFPDAWTGQAGAAAGGPRAVSVYMPTDTTQLGYYYQTVPQWHAYRGMVPPTPVPSQWHRPLCNGPGCQQCRQQGQVIEQGQPAPQNEQQAAPTPMEPTPAEEAPMPMAPQPPLEKAERPDLQPIN